MGLALDDPSYLRKLAASTRLRSRLTLAQAVEVSQALNAAAEAIAATELTDEEAMNEWEDGYAAGVRDAERLEVVG